MRKNYVKLPGTTIKKPLKLNALKKGDLSNFPQITEKSSPNNSVLESKSSQLTRINSFLSNVRPLYLLKISENWRFF